MRRTVRTAALTTLMALTVLLVGTTAAFAQYPPDTDFGVTCTPQNPGPGDSVSCSVVGAQSAEVLSATAETDGDQFYSESMTADGDGEAGFGFEVPATAAGNDVIVTVSGDQSGTTTTTLAAADVDEDPAEDVVPDDVDDDDRLPVTGGQLAILTLVGLGMVTTGGLAIRKRSTTKA